MTSHSVRNDGNGSFYPDTLIQFFPLDYRLGFGRGFGLGLEKNKGDPKAANFFIPYRI